MVENLRPEAEAVGSLSAVLHPDTWTSCRQRCIPVTSATAPSQSAFSLVCLGPMIQTYFYLGKLPNASCAEVLSPLAATEQAALQLFHPTVLKKMGGVMAVAKHSAEAKCDGGGRSGKNAKYGDHKGNAVGVGLHKIVELTTTPNAALKMAYR